ncbi:hypothetical protein EMPS_03301 [Entomortierella parvispora]|uniref:Protein kinase domain-containing protein n=1 Tax=Entomortierella parvispora TaxID=205924 RepID=A0A9P3H6I8_9FUNG|nr:hypothetical protein EMPS_03301 [Entomortierella parvispora]
MSNLAPPPPPLNRRPSIHTSSRASSARTTSNRQPSTFEIEVEYISHNQLPLRHSASRPNLETLDELGDQDPHQDNPPPPVQHALERVIEEVEGQDEEEEDDEGIGAILGQGLQRDTSTPPPQNRPSPRPYPATLPRQRPIRPTSQQVMPQSWHQQLQQHQHISALPSVPEDRFTRIYQPALHAARQSNHSVGNQHSVQTSIAHSEYLQSSHVEHDDTPALSVTGSQSEDEDEPDLRSPMDCLELINDEDVPEQEGILEPTQGTGTSMEGIRPVMPPIPEPSEIETHETLKRERTRILERRVVSSYRQIDYQDISNVQPLKKGGYGEIHTAEWSHLRVVLKRALPEHSEGVEQFEQELEILKRVHDYDFIVPFYGVTTDPRTNVKCMVMKHCTNGNLCTFLEKNHCNLTWSERYRLSIEITKGLEFLHKSGFHHRDLHSGNILLDDKRTAMICDFGLSRSSSKDQTSDIAATVGVASFLAPERFPAKRPIYNAACDIYSLGVIFWHISSGRIPFAKRLREPMLLKELMEGLREETVPGTPKEYREMLVKCWDVKPAKRLKIDVVIAILQTLMARPQEPIHQAATGFSVPSETESAALPIPPELNSRMASLERASNTLNRMVFDIQDPMMQDVVQYITRTRAYFRERSEPLEPYSTSNPPRTPIFLCPLVGDIAALHYYLTRGGSYNPINESSAKTGDTALHLACLFLESPMDTIKILVELGADINLENLQGYTPVMILVSSNTQYCYEALKFFVMRGARIPAYIRNPITPLNSAQIYALNLVNESRRVHEGDSTTADGGEGVGGGNGGTSAQDRRHSRQQHRVSLQNQNVFQERGGRKVDRLMAQGRPLIHVVAAMQEDYRILDCLCEAGLDPAMSFGGETALAAAAAHLRIKNVEWLLNHDLDISSEAGIQRAIKVVKLLHQQSSPLGTNLTFSTSDPHHHHGYHQGYNHGRSASTPGSNGRLMEHMNVPKDFPDNLRDLGRYSWAGVAYGEADGIGRDMVGPVLHLLNQWTGSQRIAKRKEVATKLKVMYGSSMDPITSHHEGPSCVSVASTNSNGSNSSQGSHGGGGQPLPHHLPRPSQQNLPYLHHPTNPNTFHGRGPVVQSARSLRKSQRHLIDQALNEKPRFW